MRVKYLSPISALFLVFIFCFFALPLNALADHYNPCTSFQESKGCVTRSVWKPGIETNTYCRKGLFACPFPATGSAERASRTSIR